MNNNKDQIERKKKRTLGKQKTAHRTEENFKIYTVEIPRDIVSMK